VKIKVGISARHVHLCEEDLNKLFGEGYKLTFFKPLSQLHEFASHETVNIKTESGELKNMRILGPVRPYTQVEITQTEAYQLKINPPVRSSGDLDDSSEVTIIGPFGSVTKNCCIIAARHIHLNPEQANNYNLNDMEVVSVKCDTAKKTLFQDVVVRIKETYMAELHIDNDDSNGNLLNHGDLVTIIKD